MRVPPPQSGIACAGQPERPRRSGSRSCGVSRVSRVPNVNASTWRPARGRGLEEQTIARAYGSIDPDTSHRNDELARHELRCR